jgi:LmbE family N-acetylglucosaminyl deacetylase
MQLGENRERDADRASARGLRVVDLRRHYTLRATIAYMLSLRWVFVLIFLITTVRSAEIPKAPPELPPDPRFKTDVLVIVAHPDDETEVTAYLAKAIFDEHKRVSVIFGTRGNGGGNEAGNEQADALSAVREIEAREALAKFGVLHVWFLDGPDTPGQDVLRSLETWHHGEALAKAVRLVRLTRPEVILTWLPLYVAGENHGDHQASSVIATEAFDLAGDPTVFPEQLSPPRNRRDIGNLTEGLHPWQPKKLYFFSDSSHTDFQEGQGPRYDPKTVSPAKGVSYARLAAEEMAYHLTQGDTGQVAMDALKKGDLKAFEEPVQLIFGKSLVRSSTTGDILESITSNSIPFARVSGYQPSEKTGLSMELAGPWSFYREFWKAHDIGHIADLLKEPEVMISPGEKLTLPITITNSESTAQEVTLQAVLPDGWREERGQAIYPVDPRGSYTVQTVVQSPAGAQKGWVKPNIVWKAEAGGREIGSIHMRVLIGGGGLPQ